MPLEKFSPPLEKCVGDILSLLDTVLKIFPLSENSSPPLVSQAGNGPDPAFAESHRLLCVTLSKELLAIHV